LWDQIMAYGAYIAAGGNPDSPPEE